METHYRAESAKLKPADQQLMEFRIMDISAVEASDVRSPPGDPGDSHIQSCRQLISQGTEGRINIPGPHQCSVPLAAGPGTAEKVQDILLSFFLHSLVSHPGVLSWIDISHFHICSPEIPVMGELIAGELRFRLVQPENMDTFLIIIFLDLAPYIFSSIRICHVNDRRIAQLSQTLALF